MSLRFNLRQQQYLFRFKISFLLFCLFFVSLFCVLGEWQLYRYHFKQMLLTSYHERANAKPESFVSLVTAPQDMQFRHVTVVGHYLNAETLLLQNRFYKEQPGFEVLTPLQISGQKKRLLVDRGWIAKPQDAALPTIAVVTAQQKITGNIKLLNEYQFILGKNILQPTQTPIVMQKIDMKEISNIHHQEFYPFILRLDVQEKNGFVRDWIVSAGNPERHLGYAVQWFLMAIALAIAYLCFCFERVGNTNDASS